MNAPSLAQATNPRTPLRVLLQLAEDHPGEVANNPSFLRQPQALQQADLYAALALATCPDAPEGLLRQGAMHARREVRAAVAQNGATPLSILQQLAFDDDAEVRETALQREGTEKLRRLHEELKTLPPVTVRGWLGQGVYAMQNAAIPGSVRAYLASQLGPNLAAFLGSPACAASVARELIETWRAGRTDMLQIARDEHFFTPNHRMKTQHWMINAQVARYLVQFTPIDGDFLGFLFSDKVRFCSSYYQPSPDNTVLHLLDAVLAHPAFSPAILEGMSQHGLALVRIEALRHAGAQAHWLPRMLGDMSHNVRREAWYHPRLPAEWTARLRRLGFEPGLAVKPAATKLLPDDRKALRGCGPWLKSWAA